VSTLTSSM